MFQTTNHYHFCSTWPKSTVPKSIVFLPKSHHGFPRCVLPWKKKDLFKKCKISPKKCTLPKTPKLKFCLWKIRSKHEYISERQGSFQNVEYVTMFWQCQKRGTLLNMQHSCRTLRAIFLQNMPCILPSCRILLEQKYVASKRHNLSSRSQCSCKIGKIPSTECAVPLWRDSLF